MKLTLEQIKEKMLRDDSLRTMDRSCQVTFENRNEDINEEDRTIWLSVSSDTEVERWFGYEVLDHKEKSVRTERLKDGMSHRDEHNGDQVAVVTDYKFIKDGDRRKLRVKLLFSEGERADLIYRDMIKGIRKNVSIRYAVHELVMEKEVEDVSYYRVVDWEIIHTATVADPADHTVGVGRSEEEAPETIPLNISPDVAKNVREQIEKFNDSQNKTKIIVTEINNPKREKVVMELSKEDKEKLEKKAEARIIGIRSMAMENKELCPSSNLENEAIDFIRQDKTEIEFYNHIQELRKKDDGVRKPVGDPGAEEEDLEKYDLGRTLDLVSKGKIDDLKNEREMHDDIAKKIGYNRDGFLIPTSKIMFDIKRAERSLSVGDPAKGGYTVNEEEVAQSFIEYLHNDTPILNAGVDILPGLTGNPIFVEQLTGNQLYWLGEEEEPSDSDLTFIRRDMKPKMSGAKTKLTRQLLLQSSYLNGSYAANELVAAAKEGVANAIYYGTGSANQPLGIKNISGIAGFDGTDYDRAKAIDQRKSVIPKYRKTGAVSFLANDFTIGELQKKPIVPNFPTFLCSDDNKMVGKTITEDEMIVDGDIFYGILSSIMLGEWGYMEVFFNDKAPGWSAGILHVAVLYAMDIGYKYPAALSYVPNAHLTT